MDRIPHGKPLASRNRDADSSPKALRYSARLMRFLAPLARHAYLEEDPTYPDWCILRVDGASVRIRFLDGSVFVEGMTYSYRAIPKHTAGRAAVRKLYEDILALDVRKKAWAEEMRRQREADLANLRSTQEKAAEAQRVKAFELRRFEVLRADRKIPQHDVEFTVLNPGFATLALPNCTLAEAEAILECLQVNKLLPKAK